MIKATSVGRTFRPVLNFMVVTLLLFAGTTNSCLRAESGAPAAKKQAAEFDIANEIDVLVLEKIAVADAVQGPAMDQEQIRQGFAARLAPILKVELAFIRQTCDLTPQQRPIIKARADEILQEVARSASVTKPKSPFGLHEKDLRPMLCNRLADELIKRLRPDQSANYVQEMKLRSAFLKEATILEVVSRLDSLLHLTPEQVQRIQESLSIQWRDDWNQWLILTDQDVQAIPQFADKLVGKTLNGVQKSVWKAFPRIDLAEADGFGFEEIEEAADDDEADAWWSGAE